jgi:hypothetical protein
VLFKASSALQLGGWCSDGSIMSALFPFQCPSGQGPLLVLAFNVDFTLTKCPCVNLKISIYELATVTLNLIPKFRVNLKYLVERTGSVGTV